MKVTLAAALLSGLVKAQETARPPSVLDLIANTPQLSMYNAMIHNDTRLVNLFSSEANFDVYLTNNAGLKKFASNPQFGGLLKDKQVVYDSTLYTIAPRGFSDPQGSSAFLHTLRNTPSTSKVYGGETFRLDSGKSILSGLLTTSNVVSSSNFDSGSLHILGYPLTPPQNLTTTAAGTNVTELKTAAASKQFAALQSFNDITVFLLNGGKTFQVVRGTVAYSSFFVAGGTKITTTDGKALYLDRQGSTLLVNSTAVKTADILVENGVVHVLNSS